METKGILFIPDISGFTRFVNAGEIQHSKMIIQELLEVLINSNQLDLKVSEIEGDAILFYKFGETPPLEDLYRQVAKMFREFHQNLAAYEQNRYCWCAACKSAVNLTLKVITHYGEFTGYNVRNFHKLIGKDVIVAHELLKNNIEPHDYWLITPNLTNNQEPEKFADWMTWYRSSKEMESGKLPFQYTHIGPLKNTIATTLADSIDFNSLSKAFTLVREYDTDLIKLFHATGDFRHRNKWMEGIKSVTQITHSLPRNGMKCKLATNEGELFVSSGSYSSGPEKVAFAETYEPKKIVTSYILEKVSGNKTKLTFSYYTQKGMLAGILFNLLKKGEEEAAMNRSLQNLDRFLQQFQVSYV